MHTSDFETSHDSQDESSEDEAAQQQQAIGVQQEDQGRASNLAE